MNSFLTYAEFVDREYLDEDSDLYRLTRESRFLELVEIVPRLQDRVEESCGALIPKWHDQVIQQVCHHVYKTSAIRRSLRRAKGSIVRKTGMRVDALQKECARLQKSGNGLGVDDQGSIIDATGFAHAFRLSDIIEARIQFCVLQGIGFFSSGIEVDFSEEDMHREIEKTWQEFIGSCFSHDVGGEWFAKSEFFSELTVYFHELGKAHKPKSIDDIYGTYLLLRKQKIELQEIIGMLAYLRTEGKMTLKDFDSIVAYLLKQYGKPDLGHSFARDAIIRIL